MAKRFIAFALAGILLAQPINGAGDITFLKMDDYLKAKKLNGDYTPQKFSTLLKLWGNAISLANESASPEEKQDALCHEFFSQKKCKKMQVSYESWKPFAEIGLKKLEVAEQSHNDEEQAYAFMIAKNILYTLFSGFYETRKMKIGEALAIPFEKLKTKVPFIQKDQRQERLSLSDAKKESRFLVDPQSQTPNQFLTPQDLVGRTHEEVANLDVRADHHIWYPENLKASGDLWDVFENSMKNKIRVAKNQSYDLESARNVVFLSYFADRGGTHAKLSVKDLYGIRWKLKFGDEFFSEDIANRLYMKIGGKYQDLNYAHTAMNPVVVIFPKQISSTAGCTTSLDKLSECLLKSSKHLDLEAYSSLGARGVIGEEQLKTWKLSHLENVIPEGTKSLLGLEYMTIQAISMELQDSSIQTHGGPMAQSTMGSENDRAMRGMILFHMFLDNFDAKDANGEGVITKDIFGQTIYAQAPLDLGAAFRGSSFHGYGINFFAGSSFLDVGVFNTHRLVYPRLLVYRAEAHERATFADLAWMARKIVKLTTRDITEAVNASKMPEFFNTLLIQKLLERRNKIAMLFDLNVPDVFEPKDLFIAYELTTEKQEKDIARKLGIPQELIQTAKENAGISPGDYFVDVVMKNSEIRKCNKSLIINLLEKYVYPVGLSRDLKVASESPLKCEFNWR